MGIIAENLHAKRYVIIDMESYPTVIEELPFWDNVDGCWTCDLESASFFDLGEIEYLDLPVGGGWLPLARAAHIVMHPERFAHV
jgi:hypothetical protein